MTEHVLKVRNSEGIHTIYIAKTKEDLFNIMYQDYSGMSTYEHAKEGFIDTLIENNPTHRDRIKQEIGLEMVEYNTIEIK